MMYGSAYLMSVLTVLSRTALYSLGSASKSISRLTDKKRANLKIRSVKVRRTMSGIRGSVWHRLVVISTTSLTVVG